jgi:hypothetical protein
MRVERRNGRREEGLVKTGEEFDARNTRRRKVNRVQGQTLRSSSSSNAGGHSRRSEDSNFRIKFSSEVYFLIKLFVFCVVVLLILRWFLAPEADFVNSEGFLLLTVALLCVRVPVCFVRDARLPSHGIWNHTMNYCFIHSIITINRFVKMTCTSIHTKCIHCMHSSK